MIGPDLGEISAETAMHAAAGFIIYLGEIKITHPVLERSDKVINLGSPKSEHHKLIVVRYETLRRVAAEEFELEAGGGETGTFELIANKVFIPISRQRKVAEPARVHQFEGFGPGDKSVVGSVLEIGVVLIGRT